MRKTCVPGFQSPVQLRESLELRLHVILVRYMYVLYTQVMLYLYFWLHRDTSRLLERGGAATVKSEWGCPCVIRWIIGLTHIHLTPCLSVPREKGPIISSSTMHLLETTFVISGYLVQFSNDYRLVWDVVEEEEEGVGDEGGGGEGGGVILSLNKDCDSQLAPVWWK